MVNMICRETVWYNGESLGVATIRSSGLSLECSHFMQKPLKGRTISKFSRPWGQDTFGGTISKYMTLLVPEKYYLFRAHWLNIQKSQTAGKLQALEQ